MPKNVIVIGGPTASGKSGLAIDLAQEQDGIIINADASQVYQGISIISAAPTLADKNKAEHRLYEYLDAGINSNVFNWLGSAVAEIWDVWHKGKTPIVVGGSGLYIENLVKGTTPIPEVKPEIRQIVTDFVNQNGIQSLYDKLLSEDPAAATMLHSNDSTRVRRAYEIFLSSGKSIAEWYEQPMLQKLPEAEFLIINILPPKATLDDRCNTRFRKMISDGAIEEVRALVARNLSSDLPAMRAKGVPELASYIKNDISEEEAIALSQLHTRQYAKRQLTWFRNKLNADLILSDCYTGQKDFINDV
ncbi:MAG: tRNA (adenosine(37)-N6)-dimethylallyltransferase MiaA, partial [Alphaproteobacteria bacterium]|nr:tRNA (adenosine(37)-N6)-dimethylallyltransferase MiaA [Alphaproteobacteria bacterium]